MHWFIQNLTDNKYEITEYFSHWRGTIGNFQWEYCIPRRPQMKFNLEVSTHCGENNRAIGISLAAFGVSLYFKLNNILYEKPYKFEEGMGRNTGVYLYHDMMHFAIYETIGCGSGKLKDWKKYGISKSWFMPWSWSSSIRWEVIDGKGKLVPIVHSYEKRESDGRQIYTAPFVYICRNGEIQERIATFYVQEQEWRLLMFRKLPFRFGPKKVIRSIWVEFNDEVGERSGSWKGGTLGCGYDMLPGETALETLRRMELERKFT